MKRQDYKNIAYITLNGRIPSTSANSVGVMTMSGQFSKQGLDTMLLIPGDQGMSLSRLSDAKDEYQFYSVAAPFEIKRFPNAFRGKLSRLASLYSLALVLYTRYRGFSLITTRSLEVAVWAGRLKIPVILESHNFSKFEHHRMIKSWVAMTKKAGYAATMVVTTHAGKNSYVNLGIPQEKILVLPNGVNIKNFTNSLPQKDIRAELNLPLNANIAVFSGSLHEGRGGEEMLDCAALLPDVQLIIVGGTSAHVDFYRDLAHKRSLLNVKLVGHVDQKTLSKYLLASDFLMMPYSTRFSAHSFEYTSPMKMFEYLATGRPMVATDFPILHEILEHKRNAFFVEPDSGEALARGIQYFIDHPDEARRIGEAAKSDAMKYSWEKRAAAVINWQKSLGNIH